jgi:hypothetical protein
MVYQGFITHIDITHDHFSFDEQFLFGATSCKDEAYQGYAEP